MLPKLKSSRLLFGGILSFSAFFTALSFDLSAQTNLTFEKDVKKFTSADGKAQIYEFRVAGIEGTKETRVQAIRVRAEAGKITDFDLEWVNKKPIGKTILSELLIDDNLASTRAALDVAHLNTGKSIKTPLSADTRYFSVQDSQSLLNALPPNLSSQKNQLEKEWSKFFFGLEAGSESRFKVGKESSTISLNTSLQELVESSVSFSEHNRFALGGLQDAATRIADAGQFYGTHKTGLQKNRLRFSSIDPSLPTSAQKFPYPDFLKKGVEEKIEKIKKTEEPPVIGLKKDPTAFRK